MLKLGIFLLVAFVQLSTQCNINDYGLYPLAPYDDAIRTCALQGRQLIVPADLDELRFATLDLNWDINHWLGIHDVFQGGNFISVSNGEPFEENDILKWKEGFPNNDEGAENCVRTEKEGLVNDDCAKFNRFICKKATFGRGPLTEMNVVPFNQAVINCALKGAQLMFPISPAELGQMAFLATTFNITPLLGIHKMNDDETFVDINGDPVFPSDFLVWEEGSPTEDNCVTLLPNTLIRSVPCEMEQRYLCNR